MHQLGLRSKYPSLNGWPKYYSQAKGIMIDNYIDMAYMGIKSNILGYANETVNNAVKKAIDNGNMSSLNPRNEKVLAELLLDIHPEMDIVRYARTGGEACMIAFQIAIYYHFEKTKIININNYNIIFVGYNGWHIKQIESKYCRLYRNKINDINIDNLIRPDIIFFELIRYERPKESVIKLLKEWQEKGTILVCDEITSGFRFHPGGAYQLFGLEPDIVIFGKAMSNGFPMAAIMGKKEIMEHANDLWISSTYFTESIGPSAAIATIQELQKKDYAYLDYISLFMLDAWENQFENIKTYGPGPLISFKWDTKHEKKKLNYSKFMLENNILATDAFFPSFAHEKKHLEKFCKILKYYRHTV
jgi:acetylornithine/succinyldiaminopimelate/putrescine aminotransferase